MLLVTFCCLISHKVPFRCNIAIIPKLVKINKRILVLDYFYIVGLIVLSGVTVIYVVKYDEFYDLHYLFVVLVVVAYTLED